MEGHLVLGRLDVSLPQSPVGLATGACQCLRTGVVPDHAGAVANCISSSDCMPMAEVPMDKDAAAPKAGAVSS